MFNKQNVTNLDSTHTQTQINEGKNEYFYGWRVKWECAAVLVCHHVCEGQSSCSGISIIVRLLSLPDLKFSIIYYFTFTQHLTFSNIYYRTVSTSANDVSNIYVCWHWPGCMLLTAWSSEAGCRSPAGLGARTTSPCPVCVQSSDFSFSV